MAEAPSGEVWGPVLRPRELEREFRIRFLRDDARVATTVVGALTILATLFSLNDAQYASTTQVAGLLLALRAAFFSLGLVAVWVMLRTPRPAVLDGWVLAWVIGFALMELLVTIARPGSHDQPVLVMVLMALISWALIPTRFSFQAVGAVVIASAGVACLLVARRPTWRPESIAIAFALLTSNLLGAYVAWRVHRRRRLSHLEHRRIVQADASLRESENRFRALARETPVGIFQTDAAGKVVFANPAFLAMTGLSEEVACSHGVEWTAHPEDRERVLREWQEAFSAGKPFDAEYRHLVDDGKIVWVRTFGRPLHRGAGPVTGYVGAMVDLTEPRSLQAQIALTSRLAAMGTLVAGVAHEINNPLAGQLADQGVALEVIRGVRERLGQGQEELVRELDEAAEALEDAQAAGLRVARIVRDLDTFARPDPRRTRVSLADIVVEAMRWLPASVGQTATIRLESRAAADVMASAGQIGQVLVNLVTNAARATPAGQRGEILVRTGPGAQGMSLLEVEDRGKGIDPAILNRIFDPFFTTRPVGEGKGMGLGLAVSHAIVTAHGGSIAVASEVGKGSTFRVELPAIVEDR